MNSKRCSHCGETKPIAQFHRHAGRSDGRQSHCKACNTAKLREDRKRRATQGREVAAHQVAAIPPDEQQAAGNRFGATAYWECEARGGWQRVIVRGKRGRSWWVELEKPLHCNTARGCNEIDAGHTMMAREYTALVSESALWFADEIRESA